MLVGSRGKFKPASYVFGEFENLSDWPIGWTQISAAWLPAIWTIGAFDSVIINSKKYTMPVESFQLVYWDRLVLVVHWEQS
ncbi:hypothetical protein FOB64_006180 [Candida albicans]|uniref:Uncharacterized protein n=1 Tax=Candida albicans TaxID=5476 RepID=A0A8H6BVV0_CANAX|nr:hypothetical protein FOB64_006180 [Candida albicans]